VQAPGEFKDQGFTGREKVSLLPSADRAPMDPDGFGKVLLGQTPAFSKGFEQSSKGEKIFPRSRHVLALLLLRVCKGFSCC
jgi:hypothetical protein